MPHLERVIGTVPLIGDGNPAALLAVRTIHQRRQPEVPFTIYHPVTASLMARQLHKLMTLSERLRELYTKSGEENIRGGSAGKLLGALFYHSLVRHINQLNQAGDCEHLQLTIVQEHLLLGVPAWELIQLFAHSELWIPDSQPKRSAVHALQAHPQVQAVTWNQDTYDRLHKQGITNLRQEAPNLIAGHTSPVEYQGLYNRGVSIVVKGSGSGMPFELHQTLHHALQSQRLDWKFHLPQYALSKIGEFEVVQTFRTREERLHDFYSSLGGTTQLLITYPNEQTQALAELARCGCYPQVLLLPPRGEHEVHNIAYLLKHHAAQMRGIIMRSSQTHYSWVTALADQISCISFDQLPSVLRSL